MSVGSAVSAVSEICKLVGPPTLGQCGYILFCKIYAKDLKVHVNKLKDASARVRHSVAEAEYAGDIVEADVWTWLNKADELIESGNEILRQNNSVSCCFGLVPDPKACYILSRKAKKSLPDLNAHFADGKFDKVSYHPVLAEPNADQVKVRSSTATSSTVRYVDLKSRATVLKNIMAALNDDSISMIGVCGMGGVGKTTLLKEVESRAMESGKFDDVVSVFVSQNPDTMAIRNKIANRLGRLGLLKEDVDEATTKNKAVLILLDDLWKRLKLKDDNGVPENMTNKVKIKVVMTSRKQDLLTNEMNCHPTFTLGILDEAEGWRFFSELVSSRVEDLKRNPAAVELLKKCAGLPVSIEALATIWKKKTTTTKDSSSSSSSSSSSTVHHHLINELIKHNAGKESIGGSVSLELSYNYLGDSYEEKQAKFLFRVIGLLASTPNIPILTLLKYSVGLGLFDCSTNDINIMERARREVTRSLRTLQDSSLLLESDDSAHVKIHDVVHDVAARIASRDDRALIFNPDDDDGVKGWSKAKIEESTALSLPYYAIPEINHEEWNFQYLNIFIMEAAGAAQGDPVELPNSFFRGMVKLKVIDLKNARLTLLPSSIQSYPPHLTTLCLHYCYLENVGVIGELKSLQVLSFVGSDITQLPREIGGLTKLRMLDLSKWSKLEMIESGVLERLTRLEELYLKESFDRWENQGSSSLNELNNLLQLSTLEVHVPNTTSGKLPLISLPVLVNLVRYKVLIGVTWDRSGKFKEVRTLKFKMISENILAEEWLQSALQRTQDLHVDGLTGTRESFHEVCRGGFKDLKHLHLQDSSSIHYIIWSTEWLASSAFTILESMNLEKMENLEKICHGLINPISFGKLKVVKIQECLKLRNLFDLSVVKSLTELEEIEVSNCKMVKEIVIAEQMEDDEDHKGAMCCSNNLFSCPTKRCTKTTSDAKEGMAGADYEIILGKLRCLRLRNITEITTFFTKEAPSESMKNVIPAFFNDQQISSQGCKLLDLSPSAKFKEIRSSTHLGLDNLRRLEIANCKEIVHLIDSQIVLKLQNLESLTIARCNSLEDIFDLEGIDSKSGTIKILPKLYELKLKNLPRLIHIWKKGSKQIKGCQKLRTLEIYDCKGLPYLCNSSMCEGMENLTEINIVQCSKMKTIFLEEHEAVNDASTTIRLLSLKNLGISECPNLKAFLSRKKRAYLCCGQHHQPFFNKKVFLPSLETLVISQAGEFEKLWCGEVPDQSYRNLEFLDLNKCDTLSTIFPASLMERLQNLKQLRISGCEKMKTIIDIDAGWKTKKKPKALMLPQLQELKLELLENLRHIMEPGDVLGFPCLTRFEVHKCSNLIYLMATTTSTTLLKLERLKISECREMNEVIHGEVSKRNKRNDITFPHLTSLTMDTLYKLTCFTSENYLFDFTCLKVLYISHCGFMKTLVKPRSDGLLGSQYEDQVNIAATQALFNEKVDLPNLEELHILNLEVKELWCNEPPTTGSFCKLKLLNIFRCPRLQNVIPLFMIKRLQNLEHMKIENCDVLKNIFTINSTQQIQLHDSIEHEGFVVEEGVHASDQIIRLMKLKSLELRNNTILSDLWSGSYILEVPSLKTLAVENSTVEVVEAIIIKVHLPKLEELKVFNIEDITVLWHSEPPAGSFCKLKHLQVEQCGRLVKIIPLFMLKRLQNLEMLVVKKCDDLKKVSELGGLNDVQDSESKLPHVPFKNLASIDVESCKCLINLFNISGRDHEYEETIGSDKIALRQLTYLRLKDLQKFSHLFQGQGEFTLELLSLKKFFLIKSGAKEAITQKVVFPEELEVDEIDKEVEDISFFGSTMSSVVTNIMKALKSHQNNQIIGLLGKMEVGLRQELAWRLEADMFDEVVIALASAYSIQEAFGKELGIIYRETGVDGRASQRLRESLLNRREKRLLLILRDMNQELDLEAVGIPRDGLDPELFKIILVSEKRWVLDKMNAQQVINIDWRENESSYRWRIFEKELDDSKRLVFPKQQELPAVDTKTKEISRFFVGSNTAVMNDIMKALHSSHQNNNQIIGLRGEMSYDSSLFTELERLVKKEEKLFDEILVNKLAFLFIDRGVRRTAQHLREGLSSSSYNLQDKRLLIILNSLNKAIDLKDAGILGKELDHLKLTMIILVSEETKVLEKMGAQQVINIGSDILIGRCWRVLDGYVAVTELGKLAEECGSDHLAKLLAKKLKGQGLRSWANAFQRLKDSPFEYEARKSVIDSL